MFTVSDEQFAELVDQAFARLPKTHRQSVKNVALVYADEPTPEQRQTLKLRCDQTLYGLYEGVPLTQRGGHTHFPPDKITLFKLPMEHGVNSLAELQQAIYHTLWHEVAHYFGLNHQQIHSLE